MARFTDDSISTLDDAIKSLENSYYVAALYKYLLREYPEIADKYKDKVICETYNLLLQDLKDIKND
jgi:hypothetical protein